MRLVLFTTSGNQSYVFASNRLRESVGASYLISELTTDTVLREAGRVGGEILQSSSGSALVLVDDVERALRLVTAVTTAALDRAPGLALLGVHQEIGGDEPTAAEVADVFELSRRHAARVPGAAARFARLPVVAACGSTDLPAASWHSDVPAGGSAAELPQPLSAEAIAKRAARPPATARMAQLLDATEHGGDLRLRPIGDLFDQVDWVGVVHADANRLGSVFQCAADVLPALDESLGEPTMARLSSEVRQCAENAFGSAVALVAGLCGRTTDLPVVPLVIGGDDLTVLVDGSHALAFTTEFLTAFGRYAASRPLVREVSARVNDGHGLTASAGVAIIKPHFPFSTGYQLADELCDSAKSLARGHAGAHALDVHVLLDSTAVDLATIRAKYLVDDGGRPVSTTRRPYLLPAAPDHDLPPERDWAAFAPSALAVLEARQSADTAVVTRTQLHALRTELRTDLDRAQRRLSDLERRAVNPADRALLAALAGSPARVRTEHGVAPVLDLLELDEFARTEITP